MDSVKGKDEARKRRLTRYWEGIKKLERKGKKGKGSKQEGRLG